jgi:hypothetical protein
MNAPDWSASSFQVGYLTATIKSALANLKYGHADGAASQLREALAKLHRETGDDFFGGAQ